MKTFVGEYWLKAAKKNPWIRQAYDPPFSKESFYFCFDFQELKDKFKQGNWCLGQAFVLGQLCFIQQNNGGDEWLVFRGPVEFESISAMKMIENNTFDDWYARVLKATDTQLKTLEY